MKNILKLLLASFMVAFVFISCDNDADRDWATQEPSFTLYDTTLGSNILYETMKDNPFVLTWDNTKTKTDNYSVVLSTTDDFAKKIELGKSNTNTFKTTIGVLNTAMLQAGLSPFSSQAVYVRIETGAEVSNTISFAVTVYPTAGPVITAPTAGSVVTLNSADQTAVATTITWNDYSKYGSGVTYDVAIAAKGSTNFISLGTIVIPVNNPDNVQKSLSLTNKELNTAALNVGAIINKENELDFKVTAKTSFSTPDIVLVSAIVTAKVIPYKIDYPDFFLVGGASAVDWDAANSIKFYKHDNISEIYTYLQPNDFRFLGQADWNPINYSIDAVGIKDNYKYFKTVSSNIEKAGGDENMKFTGVAGIYKVVIDADFGVKSLTATATTSVWDIPNLYLVGSIQGWNAAGAEKFESLGNGKFTMTRQIPDNAQFKFLGQQDWSGKEWGNIHSSGNTGFLGINGDNDNISINGGDSTYTITVDLKAGTYKLTKL